jgi:serine/threonine-protein kinase
MTKGVPIFDGVTRSGTVGPYDVLEQVGRGRTAEVYLARASSGAKETRVVLKRLRAELLEDAEYRDTFAAQADLTIRLRHPNLVATLEARKEGTEPVTVMEFLDGRTLAQVRRRPQALTAIPLPIHVRVIAHVLGALHYLHESSEPPATDGIVHGDVRPDKIFVTYDGEVKLLHSGIAGAAADTGTGIIKDRLSYMSPEHARGEPIDRRSDIFSIGVMLWEAITGLKFWQDWHELAIYRRLCSDSLPVLPPWSPIAARELFDIAERAVSVSPDDRYSTAGEMQRALDEILLEPPNVVTRADLRAFMTEAFGGSRDPFDSLSEADAPTIARPLPPFRMPPVSAVAQATDRADEGEKAAAQERVTPSSTPGWTAPPPTAPGQPPRALFIFIGAASVLIGGLMLTKVTAQQVESAPRPHATIAASACEVPAARPMLVPVASLAVASGSASAAPPTSPPPRPTPSAEDAPRPIPPKNPRPRKPVPEDPWGI